MLILSRKPGEQVVVPECGVSVTVVAVTGKTIQLGISAPANVPVVRGEIVRRPRPQAGRGKTSPTDDDDPEPCSIPSAVGQTSTPARGVIRPQRDRRAERPVGRGDDPLYESWQKLLAKYRRRQAHLRP